MSGVVFILTMNIFVLRLYCNFYNFIKTVNKYFIMPLSYLHFRSKDLDFSRF